MNKNIHFFFRPDEVLIFFSFYIRCLQSLEGDLGKKRGKNVETNLFCIQLKRDHPVVRFAKHSFFAAAAVDINKITAKTTSQKSC